VAGGGLAAKINSGESDAFVFNFSKGLLFDLTITGTLCASTHRLACHGALLHTTRQHVVRCRWRDNFGRECERPSIRERRCNARSNSCWSVPTSA